MTTNYLSFRTELRINAEDLTDTQFRFFKARIALTLFDGLIRGTRVDTGRARGGTTLGLGGPGPPTNFLLPGGDVGRMGPGGTARVLGFVSAVNRAPRDLNFHATNHVTYARYLNDGTETFAGDRFIERTLARLGSIEVRSERPPLG